MKKSQTAFRVSFLRVLLSRLKKLKNERSEYLYIDQPVRSHKCKQNEASIFSKPQSGFIKTHSLTSSTKYLSPLTSFFSPLAILPHQRLSPLNYLSLPSFTHIPPPSTMDRNELVARIKLIAGKIELLEQTEDLRSKTCSLVLRVPTPSPSPSKRNLITITSLPSARRSTILGSNTATSSLLFERSTLTWR